MKIKIFHNEKEAGHESLLFRIAPVICAVSLAFYLMFSHGIRFLFSDSKYYLALYKMAFPDGFLKGLPRHLSLIPTIAPGHDQLLLLGFFAVCLASAWLVYSLYCAHRSELGPYLILFTLAAAIVPSLFSAMFFWPDGRGKLTLDLALYSSVFILIVLASLRLTLFWSKAITKPEPLPEKHEPLGWAWAFILPAAILWFFVYLNAYISIPRGYDALAYHLPLAASWFHHGSITRGFDIQYFYPGNDELLLRWGLIGGSDRLVFMVPFITSILLIYMVFKIGRVIGQSRQPALISACCVSTIPIIPSLATTAYTDTMGALFLLLCAYFLIRWIQANLETGIYLFCSGLAAGLAAGTKINMLTSAFAISIIALFAVLRSKHIFRDYGLKPENVGLNWQWMLSRAGIYFSASLAGGGFWYLRNWIEKGNPFFPVAAFGFPGYGLGAIINFPEGYPTSILGKLIYPWAEHVYHSPYDDGIGAVMTAIVIPAFILWPFLYFRKKAASRTGPGIIYSIACISLFILFSTDMMWIRYGLFAVLICFVLIGELLTLAPSAWLKTLIFAAFLIMAASLTWDFGRGYLYGYARKNETRAERLGVPGIVNSLPSTRIFNAAGQAHTYGLMGNDYRHEVVTLFKEAMPEDVLIYHPNFILLRKQQEGIFRAKLPLEPAGTETKGLDPVTLWKITRLP